MKTSNLWSLLLNPRLVTTTMATTSPPAFGLPLKATRDRAANNDMLRPDHDDDRWAFVGPASITEQWNVLREGEYGAIYSHLLPTEPVYDTHQTTLGLLKSHSSAKILCLQRFKVWWLRPFFCGDTTGSTIPRETILLLSHDQNGNQDSYRLILPILLPLNKNGCSSCSLHASTTNREIRLESPTGGLIGLYCGVGPDPYKLIKEGVEMATAEMSSSSSSASKESNSQSSTKSPTTTSRLFSNTLGWCSWNACGTEVTGSKVIDAVSGLQAKGVPIRWMILDDGWQHTSNDKARDGEQWFERLQSLKASPSKFPEESRIDEENDDKLLSLKDTVRTLKEKNGLEYVLAWHALAGYWLGLDPSSSLLPPSTLRPVQIPPGILFNEPPPEGFQQPALGLPGDPQAFFNAYHDYIKDSGVDGVKVDVQGVVGSLRYNDNVHNHDILVQMHNAMAASVQKHFTPKASHIIIHCMCHAPEIFFRLKSLYQQPPLMRASDDHYPNNPSSHGPHVVACAFNSLLFRHLGVTPDWDMFTTVSNMPREMVWMHATARAISGGPVYISDQAHNTDADILKAVACEDGTILPCTATAVPIRSCLCQDPLQPGADPLLLQNANAHSGVLGIFHVAGSGDWDYKALTYAGGGNNPTQGCRVSVRPSDVENFALVPNQSILAWTFRSNQYFLLPSLDSSVTIEQPPGMLCDTLSLVPLQQVGDVELGFLGYRGMINAPGCIKDITVVNNKVVEVTVSGCGEFRLAVRPADTSLTIIIDGQEADFKKENSPEEWSGFQLLSFQVPVNKTEMKIIRVELSE